MQRRNFLAGLGLTAATVPLLRPTSVFAQEVPAKKIIFFLTRNGPDPEGFYPASGAPITSSECLAPLAAFEGQLSLLEGLDNRAAMDNAPDHQPDFKGLMSGFPAVRGARRPGCTEDREERCYTWNAQGTSLDFALSDVAAVRGDTTHRTLHLGVKAPQSGGKVEASFRGTTPSWAENDPFRVYDRLFEGAELDDSARVALARRRTTLLDAVRGDIGAIRGRLGCEHRAAFDRHLTSLEELEGQLSGAGECTMPARGATFDPRADANLPMTSAAQRRLLVAAMGCDMTRIGVLQYCNGQESFPFAPIAFTGGNWHGYIHGTGASESARMALQRKITRWFAGEMAALLGALRDTPDAGGTTLLDNTVVVWLHEQGKTTSHRRYHIPVVLAGSCSGALRTGVRHDYRTGASTGRPHNDLLVTLAQAMGASAIEQFGEPALNRNTLGEVLR